MRSTSPVPPDPLHRRVRHRRQAAAEEQGPTCRWTYRRDDALRPPTPTRWRQSLQRPIPATGAQCGSVPYLGLCWSGVGWTSGQGTRLLRPLDHHRQGRHRHPGPQGSPLDERSRAPASQSTLPMPTALKKILAEHLATKGVNASDGAVYTLRPPKVVCCGTHIGVGGCRCTPCPLLDARALASRISAEPDATTLVRDGVDIRIAQPLLRHTDAD